MKKLLLILIAVILIIPSCSFTKAPTHYKAYPQDIDSKVIVCVGDSLTNCDMYQKRMRALLGENWTVVNEGVWGSTTTEMAFHFPVALSYNPYAVIIMGGRHDFNMSVAENIIETNLYTMYKMAYDEGVKVVALTEPAPRMSTYPPDSTFFSVNSWISSAPYVDYFIDAYALTVDPLEPGRLAEIYDIGDGTHFNQLAGDVIGDAIYNAMFVDPAPIPHAPAPPPVISQSTPTPENGVVYYSPPADVGDTGLNFGGLTVDSQGIVIYDKTINSSKGEVELTVNSGTVALDINGNPLHIIRIDETTENISGNMVKVYDLKPNGADFSQNCTLKFNYLPSDNITQVVSWNGTDWQVLESTANPKIKVVICNITHFSKYALIEMEAPKIAEITLTLEQTRYMEFLKLCFSFSMNSYFIPFFK